MINIDEPCCHKLLQKYGCPFFGSFWERFVNTFEWRLPGASTGSTPPGAKSVCFQRGRPSLGSLPHPAGKACENGRF